MVSLWDMLSLLSIVSTLGGAASGAALAGGGGARLGLGVVLGLGLGVLFTVGLRKMGDRVFRSIPDEDLSGRSPLRLRLIYVAAVVWVLLPAPLLGNLIAHRLIRVVLP